MKPPWIRSVDVRVRPRVHLHIERLILDGLPVTPAQGPAVQAAVVAELQRLLSAGGLSAEFAGGGAFVGTKGAGIQVAPGAGPADLGGRIGHSVYKGLSGGPGEGTP